jgi:DNA-binding transcriptional regulator LsrR (DeoR family)
MSKHKRDYPDDLLLEICTLWFKDKMGPAKIQKTINDREEYELSREDIYSLIKESRDRGFIFFSPPEHIKLSRELHTRYGGTIKVVSTGDTAIGEGLAASAAELVINKIKNLGGTGNNKRKKNDSKNKVHLGIGAGYTAREVTSKIAEHYDEDTTLPPLEIHAITSGFKSDEAELSPISWFSWFMKGSSKRVSFVGLFAPPMVEDNTTYEKIKELPGVKEAYEKAKDIQIVVTSLGDAQSAEYWFPYVTEEGKKTLRKDHGWKGDVLYCPYSDKGPILGKDLERFAVTLFNIEDLVNLAKDQINHMVVLVCGPSHEKKSIRKTEALKPLLKNMDLRVWSHLITDVGTAHELLESDS